MLRRCCIVFLVSTDQQYFGVLQNAADTGKEVDHALRRSAYPAKGRPTLDECGCLNGYEPQLMKND